MTAGTVVGSLPAVVLNTDLFQVGNVPGDARSLLFDANMLGGSLTVSVGGSLAPIINLGLEPSFFHGYGVDLTGWSGKTTELRFTINPSAGQFPYGNVQLDNIRFSPVALVPEPSVWALFGVGGLALVWAAGRQRP